MSLPLAGGRRELQGRRADDDSEGDPRRAAAELAISSRAITEHKVWVLVAEDHRLLPGIPGETGRWKICGWSQA